MDWKLIGLGALINAALTIALTYIFFPLIFIGPIIGGLLSSYPGKGFEDYDKMDEKDGAVIGAVSGLIGGLIICLLFLLGFGNINTFIGSISTNMGQLEGVLNLETGHGTEYDIRFKELNYKERL